MSDTRFLVNPYSNGSDQHALWLGHPNVREPCMYHRQSSQLTQFTFWTAGWIANGFAGDEHFIHKCSASATDIKSASDSASSFQCICRDHIGRVEVLELSSGVSQLRIHSRYMASFHDLLLIWSKLKSWLLRTHYSGKIVMLQRSSSIY